MVDGVTNEHQYLNNDVLAIAAQEKCKSLNFRQHYSTYSECYNPYCTLQDAEIIRIYTSEWFNYRLDRCYSGLYQLHCAANALQVKVVSYYANSCVRSIHDDMNRAMYPLGYSGEEDCLKECLILWTTSSGQSTRFDHFVPLLQCIGLGN